MGSRDAPRTRTLEACATWRGHPACGFWRHPCRQFWWQGQNAPRPLAVFWSGLRLAEPVLNLAAVNSNGYDVVIIGCGPGGSSAATFLARAGKRVLALEKEIFPRFHIGESLLPANYTIFREMGVLPKLQEAGFLRKLGARF